MGATEPLTGVPQPPAERDLPGRAHRREDLLAVIAAEQARPRAARWAVPLGAAAAVVAVMAAAVALAPLTGHHSAPRGAAGGSRATAGPRTAACHLPAGTECTRVDRFTAAAPRGGLLVRDTVGSVTITGTAGGDAVSVTERFSYRGLPPETIRSSSNGVLALGYRCRSGSCGVAYDITVPRSLSVTVTAGTASIWLNSLAGQVRANAAVGAIHGQHLSGSLAQFRTGVGLIDAAFVAAPGRLDASALTGAVTLLVPADAGYAVTATSDLGLVSVRVRQDASSGHVIQASAGVGSVTVSGG
jgi:hypothetical protein